MDRLVLERRLHVSGGFNGLMIILYGSPEKQLAHAILMFWGVCMYTSLAVELDDSLDLKFGN
ncbi:hypothetical protein ACJX0J_032671 [Zea mays]